VAKMAFSSPEVEPDFVKISHFSFDKNAPDIDVSDIEFKKLSFNNGIPS
jgi:hypothetical protein